MVALAFVAWMLLRTFPNLVHMSRDEWRDMGAAFLQKMQKKDAAWLPCLYLVWAMVFWGDAGCGIATSGYTSPHKACAKSTSCRWACTTAFGQNWQIEWSEVRGITTRRTDVLNGNIQPDGMGRDRAVQLGKGRQRVLRHKYYFSFLSNFENGINLLNIKSTGDGRSLQRYCISPFGYKIFGIIFPISELFCI